MQVKRQSNGEVIDLGSEIARGGEGAIHSYPRDASLVMKIYHADKLKDIDSDKLQLMVANPPDDSVKKNHGCVSIAWPVDLLLSIDGSEQIMGFLMPRVPMQQVRPIHDYYSPKTRREENLGFNYFSLHRTARNFAGAMSALHAKQYVIGDVNESNILVYDTAMVTLVDTDSFQVRDFQQGKVYRCRVGKPEYTPPELQRKTFADYDRTPEHDLFGLGVLIFQLLMEGTHPFAGVYQGTGDPPPTEKRILAGHFPHGSKTVPYRPAPNAVRFDVLHPTLRQLFIRCFEDGHNNPQARPDARSWVKALDEAEKALVSCGVNSEHWYGRHLRDCPWCERKKQLRGIDPFPPMSVGQSNIPVQIPLPPANTPKPVSSPAPTPTPSPTYAIPYQPTPTPTPTTTYATFSPLTAAPTATPTFNIPSLPTRKFLDKALSLGGIAAVLSVSFFLFYPHQDPELKDKQKHITDYIKAIQLDSNSADAYNKRGLVRYDLGDKQGAIADYTKAIQVDPKFADPYNNLGDAKYDSEDKKGAIADYTKAIQIDPKFAEAYKNLGDAHYHYLGDKKRAIEDYNQAIKLNSKFAEAYSNRGIAHYFLGDQKASIEDFTKAIQLNSQFAAIDYYNRGRSYYNLTDKKAAIEDYNKAIQLNHKFAEAYRERGLTRSDLGDQQAAIQDLNQAIQLDPKLAEAYHTRGIARYHLGDKKGAIEDLNQAIKLDPKLAKAYNNRGFLRSDLGDEKGAIEDYNQAIQLNHKFANAYGNRGLARYHLGDNKGAIEDYNQAIQLNSELSDAYYNRGSVRSDLGDKKGAIEDYQQAAQIDQKEGKTEEYQKSIDQIRKLQQ